MALHLQDTVLKRAPASYARLENLVPQLWEQNIRDNSINPQRRQVSDTSKDKLFDIVLNGHRKDHVREETRAASGTLLTKRKG